MWWYINYNDGSYGFNTGGRSFAVMIPCRLNTISSFSPSPCPVDIIFQHRVRGTCFISMCCRYNISLCFIVLSVTYLREGTEVIDLCSATCLGDNRQSLCYMLWFCNCLTSDLEICSHQPSENHNVHPCLLFFWDRMDLIKITSASGVRKYVLGLITNKPTLFLSEPYCPCSPMWSVHSLIRYHCTRVTNRYICTSYTCDLWIL